MNVGDKPEAYLTTYLRSWVKPLVLAMIAAVLMVIFGDRSAIQVVGSMLVSVGGVMLVDWNWRRQSQRRRHHQDLEGGGTR